MCPATRVRNGDGTPHRTKKRRPALPRIDATTPMPDRDGNKHVFSDHLGILARSSVPYSVTITRSFVVSGRKMLRASVRSGRAVPTT